MQASSQKTLPTYLAGFLGSFFLTGLAFLLVGQKLLSGPSLYWSLGLLALLQLMVQSLFFLRLNGSSSGRWHLWPYLATLILILIVVAGSLWVMANLDANMMM